MWLNRQGPKYLTQHTHRFLYLLNSRRVSLCSDDSIIILFFSVEFPLLCDIDYIRKIIIKFGLVYYIIVIRAMKWYSEK